MTLKTGVMEIQLCITGINYNLKYFKIENRYFKLQYFSVILIKLMQGFIDVQMISLTDHFWGTPEFDQIQKV